MSCTSGSAVLQEAHRKFQLRKLPDVVANGWNLRGCVWHYGVCVTGNSDPSFLAVASVAKSHFKSQKLAQSMNAVFFWMAALQKEAVFER